MTRDVTPYGADSRRASKGNYRQPINGLEGADTPVAGFYRGKLRSKGALCGFRIWYGPLRWYRCHIGYRQHKPEKRFAP